MTSLTRNEVESKDFTSLLEHIKTQLDKLEAPNSKLTYSKDELLSLCNALNDKIISDYEKALDPYSNLPEYPPFNLSDHLRTLIEKRAALKEQLLAWRLKHRSRRAKDMPSSILKETSDLFRQIKTLQPLEVEEYRNRTKAEYGLAIKGYFENKNRITLAEQQRRQERILELEKIKKRILDFFRLRESSTVNRINWQILPPGEWSIERIATHFRELERANPQCKYDLERLEHIKMLKPSTCYIGLEEFVGYVVFCFDYTEKAILENPIKGNAIYLINSNWSELSKLTKRELLSSYTDRVGRIIHRGNWFERLKAKIDIGSMVASNF